MPPTAPSRPLTPEYAGDHRFRHAEIKHGRVAMAAFVGYCVQANGIHFPWNIQGPFPSGLDTVSFGDISAAGGPADQWDALSTGAKLQILGAIGFLEMWSETSAALELDGQKHYVRGGKPGYYPTLKGRFPHPVPLKGTRSVPHPVPLDLWDPFGFTPKKMTPERKEKALLAEVNNGRLAMIGISPSCRACSSRSATSATKRSAISTKGDPVGLRASVETHHCGVVRISG